MGKDYSFKFWNWLDEHIAHNSKVSFPSAISNAICNKYDRVISNGLEGQGINIVGGNEEVWISRPCPSCDGFGEDCPTCDGEIEALPTDVQSMIVAIVEVRSVYNVENMDDVRSNLSDS